MRDQYAARLSRSFITSVLVQQTAIKSSCIPVAAPAASFIDASIRARSTKQPENRSIDDDFIPSADLSPVGQQSGPQVTGVADSALPSEINGFDISGNGRRLDPAWRGRRETMKPYEKQAGMHHKSQKDESLDEQWWRRTFGVRAVAMGVKSIPVENGFADHQTPSPGEPGLGGSTARRHEAGDLALEGRRVTRGPDHTATSRISQWPREQWQVQKKALSQKFGSSGWQPRKRLSPDALSGIRALHAQDPDKFATPVLADHFQISAEAIRRILKSKWRPNEVEEEERRERWEKRGENIWSQRSQLGIKPPKKWRSVNAGPSRANVSSATNSEISDKWGGLSRPQCREANQMEAQDTPQPQQINILLQESPVLVTPIIGDPSPSSQLGATTLKNLVHGMSFEKLDQVKLMRELPACKPCLEGMDLRIQVQQQISRPKHPNSPLGYSRTTPNQIVNFRFPQVATSAKEETTFPAKQSVYRPPDPVRRVIFPQTQGQNTLSEQHRPITRILSPGSMNGTPRSSGEFYSTSNNSTETLASEYASQESSQFMRRSANSGQESTHLAPAKTPMQEMLMMGYAQITGSFTLDGSLVNQSPFEEVKEKGILGGQGGGGLVRTQSTKRDSGILGSLGWGNLGETFGVLLGDSGLSSMKEAKKLSSSKSIPIISTPQSILFVDLQLAPGESKSYRFSHPLPRGIPPSYRGKAMKVTYNLVIGTQRAAKTAQQSRIQRVELPFKVFPYVNGQGELLGHDLMAPYTILSNSAVVTHVEPSDPAATAAETTTVPSKPNPSADDMALYVEKLLQQPEESSSSGLLSPTEDESRSLKFVIDQSRSTKELVDLAILNSQTGSSAKRSANRFEIMRSGDKVAVVMLTRLAYRLGETVTVAVDFRDSGVSCYSLHTTLETSEMIDPALALRSKASIQRVTRRIHASHFESTISAERVLINPMIPANATPEFITSGVSLGWRLRFEFVTDKSKDTKNPDEDRDGLMEEVAKDERGSVKAAVQGLFCETFDVTVPLRVYGAAAAFDEAIESGDFPI
ncbi:MAG: hypothetical protein Q9217_006592 [Psora testacea]